MGPRKMAAGDVTYSQTWRPEFKPMVEGQPVPESHPLISMCALAHSYPNTCVHTHTAGGGQKMNFKSYFGKLKK